ncbi:hypothetical protein B0O99DRAFT_507957 [Bisporella sp. PMI_857]|nr:hypothetical protein B0O99DRAFT_507957 [Bisporella sp. PMI_857]
MTYLRLIFPNIEWGNIASDIQSRKVLQLRPDISFTQRLEHDELQTLSAHNTALDGQIDGFLYVPDLNRNDACYNLSQTYFPQNVTRQANLPASDFKLVALAPWINMDCTLSYMKAARSNPVRAFLFYLPDNTTIQPPPKDSPVWNLEDDGSWKAANSYPVYAIPSDTGSQLMYQLSLYSGNMTSVPNGHAISAMSGVDPRDYVRLYTQIRVQQDMGILPMWIFVLAFLAILFGLLGIASATMHVRQRSRRRLLVKRTEVNNSHACPVDIKTHHIEATYIAPPDLSQSHRMSSHNSVPYYDNIS